MFLIAGIVFIPCGIVMLLKPQWVYMLTELWKSSVMGEPSRLYLLSTRIGGVFVTAVGILAIVAFFLR